MRSDDEQRTAIEKIFDHRRRQRRPLFGISSRSELIEQHERPLRRSGDHVLQSNEVRGERRQMFKDALVIADEDVNRVDDWDHRAVRGRQR